MTMMVKNEQMEVIMKKMTKVCNVSGSSDPEATNH